MTEMIEGRNAVLEAFRSGKCVDKLFILDGCQDGPVRTIAREARKHDTIVKFVPKERLDSMSETGAHQGVIAQVAAYDYSTVEDILKKAEEKGEPPFIILLDNIEDPHNLGAIIRTANLAGAHGVIIPKHRAVGLTATVAKTSAGALNYTPVAKVANLGQTIDELKELLGDEYRDYDLVFASTQGTPTEANYINRAFSKLIADNNLPKVVFHSLRHTSTTYKLKLSGGDIKAVQGDTGHAQATMVTERYAHILDDDRRVNAARFQKEFYGGGGTVETTEVTKSPKEQQIPMQDSLQNLDAAAKQQLLLKLLTESSDIAALLTALVGKSA